MSRYNRRTTAINANEMYEKHFEERDVRKIEQYRTPILMYPTNEQNRLLSFVSHHWSLSDKFHNLAARYYKDPKLWWIIAQYNQAPTEQHLTEGQLVKIPYPLASVYSYIGQR